MTNSRKSTMVRNHGTDSERKKIEAFIAMPYSDLPDDDKFLSDSYYGDGGYKDGSYVIPHPRETPLKYCRRRMMAYYFNYVKPCIEGNVNPIFKELPVRTYNTVEPFFDGFLADCNLNGESLNKFMKDVALNAKLFGVCAIFVENFTEDDLSQVTRSEASKQRKYPYIYILDNEQIKDYAFDRTGRLVMLTIVETRTDIDETYNKREHKIIWTWTPTNIIRQTDGDTLQVMENKIGKIPVVFLYGTKPKKNELKPTSGFYQIAKTNLALYNACSELRELLRSQAFNILVYGIGDDDDYDQVKEIVASVENIMVYRGSVNPPAYISPSAAPAEMLMNEIKLLVQEIYRMANLASVTGVQTELSGAAKEWDFESTNTTLSEFATNIEHAEMQIARIFGDYVSTDLEFTSKYNENFGVKDTSAELDEITKALALMVGGLFDKEIKKKAARLIFKNMNDTVINDVVNDIEERIDDEIQTTAENITTSGGGADEI